MALATFSLNGVPIENYGLSVTPSKGWLTIPKRTFKQVPLVTRDGMRILSAASMSAPRAIGLSFRMPGASLQARRDQLNTLFRALYGKLEIVTVEDATKVCYGYLESSDVIPWTPGLGNPLVNADLAIVCPDPLWYDLTPQAVAIGAVNTPTTLPMGNGSARMRRMLLRLAGSWSSPITAILKNAAGDELQRMAISSGTTASEYIDVDCDAFTITKYSGGTGTDVLSTLDATHDFFAIDAQDAPTLQLDKGTAVVYYYRSYVS